MLARPKTATRSWQLLPWAVVVLAGLVAPVIGLHLVAGSTAPAALGVIASPVIALGMMGTGMIGAAAAGRFWIGVSLACAAGAALVLLAVSLGMPPLPRPLSVGLAGIIASISFAARGALFARSAADKGWWIAVAVVAGEAALLVTAALLPGKLPDWLLVLLPAQWASAAIMAALTATGAASAELLALAGTAAATLLVARLWPRRWPYLVMFSAWLGFSALVWHWPASADPAEPATAVLSSPSAQQDRSG